MSYDKKRYKIGDKVYFIESFREIYWPFYYKSPPKKRKHPLEKKIVQVVSTRDGQTLYQVKDGHFAESWIDKLVFNTKAEAENAIKNNFQEIYGPPRTRDIDE